MSDESDRKELTLTRHRVIRRARAYTWLPVCLLIAFGANAVWEIINTNFIKAEFSLLDASTSVTIVGLAGGFLLTREQWVRTLRPGIGLTIEPAESSDGTIRWMFYLFNAGPGLATIEIYDFYLHVDQGVVSQPKPNDFSSLKHVTNELLSSGRTRDIDFYIKFMTPGGQIPIQQNATDGFLIAWFTTDVIRSISRFDIRIRVVDIAGDVHERIFPSRFFIDPLLPVI